MPVCLLLRICGKPALFLKMEHAAGPRQRGVPASQPPAVAQTMTAGEHGGPWTGCACSPLLLFQAAGEMSL